MATHPPTLRSSAATTSLLAVLLLLGGAQRASAGVIYYLYDAGEIVATLEVQAPPASATSGWSTSNPADLLSFSFVGFPFDWVGNASSVDFSATSVTGAALDSGELTLTFATISGDPTIDRGLSLTFSDLPGGDVGGAGATYLFSDGTVVFSDFFPQGDWLVPEPTTMMLFGVGVAGALRRHARRRRPAVTVTPRR